MTPLAQRSLIRFALLLSACAPLVGCEDDTEQEITRDSIDILYAPRAGAPIGYGFVLYPDTGTGWMDVSDDSTWTCWSDGPAVTVNFCNAAVSGPGFATVHVQGPRHEGTLEIRLDSAPFHWFGDEDVTSFDVALSDRRTAWSTSVPSLGAGSILYKTDLVTGVSTRIGGGGGLAPGSVTVDRVGQKVYHTGIAPSTVDSSMVLVYSTTGTLLDTLATVQGFNYASAFVPGVGLYVGAGSKVIRLDSLTGAQVDAVDLGSGTVLRIAAHAGTNRLYVVTFAGSFPTRVAPVYELTLDSLNTVHTRASADAYGIAVSPDGSTLYFASEGASRLYRCTVGTDACTHRRTVNRPAGIALSDDGSKVFVLTDMMVTTYQAATFAPVDHMRVQGFARLAVSTDSGPSIVFTRNRGVAMLPRGTP
jgi:hypothetical protein